MKRAIFMSRASTISSLGTALANFFNACAHDDQNGFVSKASSMAASHAAFSFVALPCIDH